VVVAVVVVVEVLTKLYSHFYFYFEWFHPKPVLKILARLTMSFYFD
jgi:hypothetical protein